MDLGLKGKVALVAGSSSGLGEAVAKSFAAEGASLVLCARSLDKLEKVKTDITHANPVDIDIIPADLSVPSNINRIISGAINRFGRVDILVNNTGGPPAGKFEDISPDKWEQTVQLLLMSTVNLIRGILPGMKGRQWGRIINVTSVAVKQPIKNLILSNSIRAAVMGLARTLANEVAPFGVTVNNVMPGYTRTQRLDYLAQKAIDGKEINSADIFRKWEMEIPMGRLGEPREFADTVVFLASERASYITGTSIAVDGGWVQNLL